MARLMLGCRWSHGLVTVGLAHLMTDPKTQPFRGRKCPSSRNSVGRCLREGDPACLRSRSAPKPDIACNAGSSTTRPCALGPSAHPRHCPVRSHSIQKGLCLTYAARIGRSLYDATCICELHCARVLAAWSCGQALRWLRTTAPCRTEQLISCVLTGACGPGFSDLAARRRGFEPQPLAVGCIAQTPCRWRVVLGNGSCCVG